MRDGRIEDLETYYGALPCPVIEREIETGLMIYANAAAAELAGLDDAGELVGKTTFALWPMHAETWRHADRAATEEPTSRVEPGRRRWFVIRRKRVDSERVLVVGVDITDSVRLRAIHAHISEVRLSSPIHVDPEVAGCVARGLRGIGDICAETGLAPEHVGNEIRRMVR